MARLLRFSLLTICLLIAKSAFATGGSCPSGSNYLVPGTANNFVTLASLGVTQCYYIAANGSDSNSGTSESNPWLHAPGMPSCSSVCASVKPSAGTGFIFRGGDTWHFGNSGASPATGGAFQSSASGANGAPIYWGVDTTWSSGGSWTRPIFDGDNPTSTSGVSSCSYDETKYTQTYWYGTYVIVDNFEYTGLCWNGNEANANENRCCTNIIMMANGSPSNSNMVLENVYIHGWTHQTFRCSESGGEPTGSCDGAIAIHGLGNTTDIITHVILDGSDTDGKSMGGVLFSCYDVEYSVFRYASQGAVCNGVHTWHDNWTDHISQSADGQSHSNGVEFPIAEASSDNYIYNNVFSNMFIHGDSGVTTWFVPHSGHTDWIWNNIWYNNPGGQLALCAASSQCAGGGGGSKWYNNTIADSGTYGVAYPGAGTHTFTNDLTVNMAYQGNTVQSNVIAISDGQALKAGFSSGTGYAYQPTASDCNGQSSSTCPAGKGTNLTSNWPSGFPTSDTSYSCTYNTNNHSLSCPARAQIARPTTGAWDVGAFQFSGTQIQAVASPTDLRATVQ
jgi:hypothetical protein